MLLQSLRPGQVPWALAAVVLLLTAYGVSQVISACWDPSATLDLGHEAQAQIQWWLVSILVALTAAHVEPSLWRASAWPLWGFGVLIIIGMQLAAGTALVPQIKGQANWIVFTPRLRVQPVEFVKLGVLLGTAHVINLPGFDARRLKDSIIGLATAAFPSIVVAKDDLGSALTIPPMAFGMLYAAGMQVRWLVTGLVVMASLSVGVVFVLPKDGYQYKRVQAWLHPDEYALTEGYQTQRSMSAIGSGQWIGKGYAAGDQNLLGWVPEKRTDLILSITGEELGFLGTSIIVGLFVLFALSGLAAAAQCRDGFGRSLITGYVCLLTGQSAINISVATGLMPVTGVTLPFFSYGGSSLVAGYLGLGMVISCAGARRGAAATRTTVLTAL
jgi:rod shape determining protein RodA